MKKRSVYDQMEQQHTYAARMLQSALPLAVKYLVSVLMDGDQATSMRCRAAESLAKLSGEAFDREAIARRLRTLSAQLNDADDGFEGLSSQQQMEVLVRRYLPVISEARQRRSDQAGTSAAAQLQALSLEQAPEPVPSVEREQLASMPPADPAEPTP